MKRNTKTIINFSLLIISFLFTSCYSWWEDKKDMDTTSAHISLGDFLYEEPEIKSLEAPSQVIASQGLYSGTVKVHWAEADNAASYRIERAVIKPDLNGNYANPDESDFEVLEKNVYSCNYSDIILTSPGATNSEYNYKYYYRISAENAAKGYDSSEFTSLDSEDTNACGWLLAAPQNLEASKGKSTESIYLTWNKVTGARSYNIYRTEDSDDSEMKKLATVRGSVTSYSDSISVKKQGTEFYYKVIAVLANGSSSADSIIAMGYALTEGAPATPSNVQVVDGYGKSKTDIQLKWDSVSGSTGQTITYSVYRTSSADSSYTLVKQAIPQATTSLTDSEGLKTGLQYYYYVQAVSQKDTTVQKSAFSESGPDSENPAMGFLLSPPSNLAIADGSDSSHVTIRFTPAVGYELQETPFYYNIYSDTQLTGVYTNLVKSVINIADYETDEEGFYNIEVEKKNFYKITTVNSDLLESALSNAAAPSPSAPKNVTASKTKGGILVTDYSPNTNGIYPVLITWEKPDDDNPYGYNVYRSTKRDSSFRKLNDSTILATGELSFVDENTTARASTFYFYKVVSLNVLETGTKSNNPVEDTENKCRGYGAISRDDWFRQYNKTSIHSQTKLTLMYKSDDMSKIGTETVKGDISGTLTYDAQIAGVGAKISMPYKNYADYYINDDPSEGVYFCLTGNSDTTSNMSGNGSMSGTVNCTGMYPGSAIYDNLEIKNRGAGGGYYSVKTLDLDGNEILAYGEVSWKVGEEER